MRSIFILYILLIICVSFVSCNGGSQSNNQAATDPGQETGGIWLQVIWPDERAFLSNQSSAVIDCGAMNVTTINANVFSDSNDLLQQGGPWDCAEGSGTISHVPAGDNHLVRLHGFDTNGNEVYRGEAANVSVQSNQTVHVDIAMVHVFNRAVTLVEDVVPGAGSSFPHRLVEMQKQLYFIALDFDLGFELFIAEPSADSVQLLKDIYPIDDAMDRSGVAAPSDFVELNGRLYFLANDASGYRLWRTDGTIANTEPVATSADYFNPTELTVLNNLIFFAADSNTAGRELWVHDEDSGQTHMVTDIRPGRDSSNPHELTTAGNCLYYVANDGQHGFEIWQTDDSATSTALVYDLYEGARGSYPKNLVDVDGRLFFVAIDGTQNPGGTPPTHSAEVWMIYKAAGGGIEIQLTADLNMSEEGWGNSRANNLTWVYGTTLAFSAYEPNSGQELYLYDWQTDTAPRRITDINPNAGVSHPANFSYMNDVLYFTAHNSSNVEHLWAYSLQQPHSLRCITAALQYPSPRDLTAFNQILYFTASHDSNDRKLWAADGIRTGLVVGSNGGKAQYSPANLIATTDRLYYTAFDTDHGEELFQLTDQ